MKRKARSRVREKNAEVTTSVARLPLDIAPQPDDTTCGPTCLHAVYNYFGDEVKLKKLIRQVPALPGGGALAVTLANHALGRGYDAIIYTYNLQLFDPTWFSGRNGEADRDYLRGKLVEQVKVKRSQRLKLATDAYLHYLDSGGRLRLGPRPSQLLRKYLKKGMPILTGLSATHLYGCAREYHDEYDSIRGEPQGHFVVLSGYDKQSRRVTVSDPLHDNPGFGTHRYEVDVESLSCAIMLGIVTYDANLLLLQPRGGKSTQNA